MNDDRNTVPGQLNIELPRVSTGLPGQASGLECVLRCMERITAMSNDRRTISGRFQKRQKAIPRGVHGRDSPRLANHEAGEIVSKILTSDTSSRRFRSSVQRDVNVARRELSLEEQHFLVSWQRPEVVGNQDLELVAGGPDGSHGGNDRVPSMLGVSE